LYSNDARSLLQSTNTINIVKILDTILIDFEFFKNTNVVRSNKYVVNFAGILFRNRRFESRLRKLPERNASAVANQNHRSTSLARKSIQRQKNVVRSK